MKKIPNISITLLIATVLLVALSFVMPKNKEKYLGDMFWTRKTFASAKYNVVLMGDSRVYRGLSPEIMEQQLPGLKVLNFGFSNGGLNTVMFKAAEEKLSKKTTIKVIVLGVTTNAITNYTQSNKQFIQELNRPREEILERLYLNPISYWFSATNPEALKNSFELEEQTSYYLSDYHMNGYVETDKFPVDTMQAIASYTNDFTNFKVEESTLNVLFEQIKVWTENGIRVIAYRPPVSQPMKELEDSLGDYNETIIQEGIQKAGGIWIEVNSNRYKTYDGSHLDKPSAERFSKELAVQIQKAIN